MKHPSEFTQIGADIEVQVLEIDKDNRRLSLGHKQLEENPWDVFETVFTVGSVHEGTIIEMLDKGCLLYTSNLSPIINRRLMHSNMSRFCLFIYLY